MATKETAELPSKDLEITEASVKVTPEEASKPEWSQEDLMVVFDSILFEGEYTEEVLIKGKLKVTFRSRSASETSEITSEIDSKHFNLVASLQEYRAFLNLVYSLDSYNGKNFKTVPLDERKKIVGKLPAVVVAALSQALYKFDGKIDAACSEGELNF